MWTTGVPGVDVASPVVMELELDQEIVSEMEYVSKVYQKLVLAPNLPVVSIFISKFRLNNF